MANRARRELAYAVGDKVWLSTRNLPLKLGTRKLAAIWAGPFTVLQAIGSVAYKLKLPEDWRIHPVFHISQLKGVVGNVEREQEILVQGGSKFEVDSIVGMRIVKGTRQFLVKWKGYEDFNNTWVPEAELGNAKEAVRDYFSLLSRVTRTRRKSGVRD